MFRARRSETSVTPRPAPIPPPGPVAFATPYCSINSLNQQCSHRRSSRETPGCKRSSRGRVKSRPPAVCCSAESMRRRRRHHRRSRPENISYHTKAVAATATSQTRPSQSPTESGSAASSGLCHFQVLQCRHAQRPGDRSCSSTPTVSRQPISGLTVLKTLRTNTSKKPFIEEPISA